jgi:hypothetical protein
LPRADVGGRQGGVLSGVAGCCESFNSQPTQVERSGNGNAVLRAVAVDRRGWLLVLYPRGAP